MATQRFSIMFSHAFPESTQSIINITDQVTGTKCFRAGLDFAYIIYVDAEGVIVTKHCNCPGVTPADYVKRSDNIKVAQMQFPTVLSFCQWLNATTDDVGTLIPLYRDKQLLSLLDLANVPSTVVHDPTFNDKQTLILIASTYLYGKSGVIIPLTLFIPRHRSLHKLIEEDKDMITRVFKDDKGTFNFWLSSSNYDPVHSKLISISDTGWGALNEAIGSIHKDNAVALLQENLVGQDIEVFIMSTANAKREITSGCLSITTTPPLTDEQTKELHDIVGHLTTSMCPIGLTVYKFIFIEGMFVFVGACYPDIGALTNGNNALKRLGDNHLVTYISSMLNSSLHI